MTEPRYQIMPELAPDDAADLRASIKERGILVAVEKDDEGNILDGHNRVALAQELGIEHYPIKIHYGLSDEEKRTFAREINLVRRHLTAAQKRGLVEGQLIDTPSLSDRAIAARLGVSHNTVAKRRDVLERRGQIDHVDERTDTLGRSQPARKQRVEYIDNSPDGRANVVKQAKVVIEQNKKHAGALGAAVGNERNDHSSDDLNLYQSPWVAVDVLHQLELAQKRHIIWEPACGPGAIAQRVVALGHDVLASDIEDYSTSPDGEINGFWESHHPVVVDFLTLEKQPFEPKQKIDIVVTNPPFNRADEFVAQALNLAKKHKIKRVAMLLRIGFMAGCGGPRCASLDDWSPERVIVFSRRLPMMHREDFEDEKANTRMDFAWFIWTEGSHGFQVERVDWKKQLRLTDEQARAVKSGAGPEILGAG